MLPSFAIWLLGCIISLKNFHFYLFIYFLWRVWVKNYLAESSQPLSLVDFQLLEGGNKETRNGCLSLLFILATKLKGI